MPFAIKQPHLSAYCYAVRSTTLSGNPYRVWLIDSASFSYTPYKKHSVRLRVRLKEEIIKKVVPFGHIVGDDVLGVPQFQPKGVSLLVGKTDNPQKNLSVSFADSSPKRRAFPWIDLVFGFSIL